MTVSVYQPLRTFRKEIRLLVIKPGDYHDELDLDLVTVSLLQKPSYHALSYCWRESPEEHTEDRYIVIRGCQISITKNVEQVIRRLRSPDTTLRIWIDAVCIEQENDDERGHQVAMMIDVYSQAERVHVWLGEDFAPQQMFVGRFKSMRCSFFCSECADCLECSPLQNNSAQNEPDHSDTPELSKHDESFRDALQLAENLAKDMHFFEALGECRVNDNGHYVTSMRWFDALDVLVAIVGRPWWKRVWVLQEVLLSSQDPIVHFSHYTFQLSTVFECCSNLLKHIKTCCRPPRMAFQTEELSKICAGGWSGMLPPHGFDVIRDFSDLKSQFDRQKLGLFGALQFSRKRNASDPRDHFYGILGLVDTFNRERSNPNYQQPVYNAFSRATGLIIIENGDLRHLQHAEGNLPYGSEQFNIPSWCIDFSRDATPSISYQLFHASGLEQYRYHWNNRILSGLDLYVYGVEIDIVAQVCDVDDLWDRRKIIQQAQEVLDGMHNFGTFPTHDMRFWRLLTHDSYQDGDEDPLRRLHSSDKDSIVNWWDNEASQMNAMPKGEETLIDHPILKTIPRNSYPTQRPSYFVTKMGFLGSRRGNVRAGDYVFVVSGAEAPMLLRPSTITRNFDWTARRFTFAGQCYLDGWMDGEAIDDKTIWEEIVLC